MRTLFVILLLTASQALASTNYLAVAIREDVKKPEKVMGKLALKEYFNDTTEVEWGSLPKYYKLAPTSNDWRIVCFAIDVGTVKKPDKKKGDIDEWILQNIASSERDKFEVIACSKDAPASIKAKGYEPKTSDTP